MIGFRHAVAGFAALLSVCTIGTETVQAQIAGEEGVLDCSPSAAAPENSCIFNLPANHTIVEGSTVSVVGEGGENLSADWELVLPGADVTIGATLVLIDRTPGLNQGRSTLFQQKERGMIKSVVSALRPGELVAVYSFDTDFSQLAGFDTDRSGALERIADLELGGSNTNIAQNLENAVRVLEGLTDVESKSILLVSDGLDESGRDIAPIIAAAQEANIRISTMANFWDSIGSAENGRGGALLERIASETGGWHEKFEMRRDVSDQLSNLIYDIESDHFTIGLIALKDSSTPRRATITILTETPELGNASERILVEFSDEFVPEIEEAPAPVTTGEISDVAEDEPATQGILTVLSEYWYLFAGGFFLLIMGLLLFFFTRRTEEEIPEPLIFPDRDEPEPAPARRSGTPSQAATQEAQRRVVGHLLVMKTGQRYPLYAGVNGIGRGSENAIKLVDEDVSRVHSEIQAVSRGQFRIADLKSLNGTYVNGSRISEPQIVKDGDELVFGQVKCRVMLG